VTANLPYDYSDSISMPMLSSMTPFHPMRMPRYPRAQMMRLRGMGRGRGFVPLYEMNYTLTNPYLYNGQYYEYFTHLVERDSKQRKQGMRNRRRSTSRSISKI